LSNGNPDFEGFTGIGDSRESPAAIGVRVLCGYFLKGNSAEIVFLCVCCWPCLPKGKDIVFRFIIEYIVA